MESRVFVHYNKFCFQRITTQILHDIHLIAEPEGQLLKIEGSTPSDVADSIEGVLQTFCINNSENKVKRLT